MEQNLQTRIRERAYALWVASGYRDGQAEQHWLIAEREVTAAAPFTAAASATRPSSSANARKRRQVRS
jgi:DUF2934 family protein